jgi:DNA-binding MarR family transcriptional regulator
VAVDDRRDEDESLSDAFWGVARRLRRLSRETLGPWEITPSQSRAVGVLMHHGRMRLSELSDQLRIAARSTTEVVDGLQDQGLVERQPDPHDRRATLVTLTDQGRTVGTAIRAARDAEVERFFGGLSETDRAELVRILRQLREGPTDLTASPTGGG